MPDPVRFQPELSPETGCTAEGPAGGPFAVLGGSYVLRNAGNVPFPYVFATDEAWILCSAPSSGVLAANESLDFAVAIDAAAVAAVPATANGKIRILIGPAGGITMTRTIPVAVHVRPGDGAAGWTKLTPSTDTRHVYVSSSSGHDANSGLSEQSAKATIRAALQLLRQGQPDWLHIRRGDQFAGGFGDWSLSGRSAAEPLVVTTYGSSTERPIFLCGTGDGLTVHGSLIQDVAFIGLHLLADGYNGSNAQPYGVSLLQPCLRVLIEDCRIERFFTNLRFQSPSHRDLKLRRCVVTDAYTATAGHAQGIYIEALSGCLIEECVFDHNGWRPSVTGAEPTIFRHNIYIQGDTANIVVRGNIVARGGSHGLQARSGGEVRNNLFLGNAINMLVGSDVQNSGSLTARVIGNVMLDSRDINASERRGWAAQFQCLASGEIAYNVAANRVAGTAPRSYDLDSTRGVGINNVDFHHNVSYKWGAPLTLSGNRFTNLLLRQNDLQEFAGSELFGTPYSSPVTGFASSGNRLYTTGAGDRWMFYANQFMSLAGWKSAVGDSTTAATQVQYARPLETIADYDRTAPYAGPGSLDAFLDQARRQSKTLWRDKFVGTNAAQHFRANFGVVVP